MIQIPEGVSIQMATEAVDMRKSITGLSVLVSEVLEMSPQSKHLFLFRNKAGDKLKGLYWDKNGFLLLYKRLEKCRFKFPKMMEGSAYVITSQQLSWLLAGFEFIRMADYPELDFSGYS